MVAVAGLLLAAGRGQRFDASGQRNKLLQPLPHRKDIDCGCVALQSAQTLLACLPLVIAVLPPGSPGSSGSPGSPELARILQAAGCEVSVCASAALGMSASLVHGLQFAERWQPAAWLVALADMPFVQRTTIEALLAAQQAAALPEAAICAPYWRGQRGNPVLFGRSHLPQLLALQGDQGARALLQSSSVTRVEVDDPGILQDIDTEADLSAKFSAKLSDISGEKSPP